MMKFSDACERFLTAKSTRHTTATREWYNYQFAAFQSWLAAQRLEDSIEIEPETIDMFLDAQKKLLSPSSLNGRWRALKALYIWLVARKKISSDDNPMPLIEEPVVPKTEPRYAAFDEFLKLLDSIPQLTWLNARDRLAVTTFFLSGLRVTELVNLQISDYDITKMAIRVDRQKGGDANVVPMLQSISDAFITYIYSRPEHPDPHVFLASDGAGGILGTPQKDGSTRYHLTRNGMYQRLSALCEKAGVERINPHAFRHGLAMHLQNTAGANTSLIQRMLRHKDERTTRDIYARWDITGVSSQYVEKMGSVDALLRGRKTEDKK